MASAHQAKIHPDDDIRMGALAGRVQLVAGVAGLVLLGVTVGLGVANGDHFQRFFHSYLVSICYWLSISLGAMFFVLIQPLTRSRWSPVIRRLAEILTGAFPVLLVLALAGIVVPMFAGASGPYHHWVFPPADDHLVHAKHAWLNVPFFGARIVGYFLVWWGISRYFFKKSVQQDASGDPAITERLRIAAGPSVIAFAVTVCFAAFDLLMSLNPHWFSTIFGIYYFAGCVIANYATLILGSMALQRSGKLQHTITTEHYHDLGKLLFAFVFFWSYTAFSQFMLIWYANLLEETVWFHVRWYTSWRDVSYALLFGHFMFPFVFLLSRWTKRWRKPLAFFAIWMLGMHYVDLFWLVMPSLTPNGASFHVMDLTALFGVGGVFVAWFARTASKVNLIPVKDPNLAHSLAFENY
jgi:hypothetical protein